MFSPGGVNGEECTSKLIQVAGRIHFFVGVELIDVPVFLQAVSWGLALRSLLCGSPTSPVMTWQLTSLTPESESHCLVCWSGVLHSITGWREWNPIIFAIFCWIEASHKFCLYSGGGDYTKVWPVGGHLRNLPTSVHFWLFHWLVFPRNLSII